MLVRKNGFGIYPIITITMQLSQDEIKAHHAQLEAKLPPGWILRKIITADDTLIDLGNGYHGHDTVYIEVDKDNWLYNEPLLNALTANKLNLATTSGVSTSASNITGQWRYFIEVSLYRRRFSNFIKQELARLHEIIMERPADW